MLVWGRKGCKDEQPLAGKLGLLFWGCGGLPLSQFLLYPFKYSVVWGFF